MLSYSDWAGDRVTRQSTTSVRPVVTTVSTSSMQAEYQAMYARMKVLVCPRGVFGNIGRPEDEPTPFYIDSQTAAFGFPQEVDAQTYKVSLD